MDIFILAVSAMVLFTLGYGVFWTVRAVRRVGIRRFARALGTLGWALLVAGSKLFLPRKNKALDRKTSQEDGIIDAFNNVRFADEALHRSLNGTITPDPPDVWNDSSHV
jgi:hypothetical protein